MALEYYESPFHATMSVEEANKRCSEVDNEISEERRKYIGEVSSKALEKSREDFYDWSGIKTSTKLDTEAIQEAINNYSNPKFKEELKKAGELTEVLKERFSDAMKSVLEGWTARGRVRQVPEETIKVSSPYGWCVQIRYRDVPEEYIETSYACGYTKKTFTYTYMDGTVDTVTTKWRKSNDT